MLCFVCIVFFFFKQKTAYEMRISDWSSDVCSSDLKARKALSAIRDEQDRRLHEARRAIHAEFGDAISAASKALNEASANVRKVKDTAPDHPWTGKRVRREKPVGYHWENRTETVSGIVDTYRSTTHRPANLGSWRMPNRKGVVKGKSVS